MALNASGKLSIGGSTTGESINLELSRSATATSTMDESALRTLAGKASGAITVDDFHGKSSIPQVNLTISANTSVYNAATAAGNPAGQRAVTVTINSGVTVSGALIDRSFSTGTWGAGSTFTLINNGSIVGKGGDGGGADGETAIYCSLDITIDNTNGKIFGGGGGGAQGVASTLYGEGIGSAGGGGGGGGQGWPMGAGRAATNYGGALATDGADATISGPGAGGDPGVNGGYGVYGSYGGGGAAFGEDGGSTNPNSEHYANYNFGKAGKAIEKNGHNITWTGGYNTSQVKGPII